MTKDRVIVVVDHDTGQAFVPADEAVRRRVEKVIRGPAFDNTEPTAPAPLDWPLHVSLWTRFLSLFRRRP